MPSKYQEYRQMADTAERQLTSSYKSWTQFLRTAARLYKYPYNEQVMIHAQRPDATACAEYDFWNKKMGRFVRRGSTGIALIDTSGQKPQLRYVFDVADTGEREHSRPMHLWQFRAEHEDAVAAALERSYGVSGKDGIVEQMESAAAKLAREYWADYKRDILHNIDDSYLKDDADKNHLIVDEYAADIVRDIFSWKLEGMSPQDIAARLNRNGVLSPMEYKKSLGMKFATSFKANPQALWSANAVLRILKNPVYTGVLIQGKETTPSYKVRKRVTKPENEWAVVPDTHEAIIERRDFDSVQKALSLDTRRSPGDSAVQLFSGMVFCGECGASMVRKTIPSGNKKYVYYVCAAHKQDKSCSPHRMRDEALADIVLETLRQYILDVVDLDDILAMTDTAPLRTAEAQKVQRQLDKKRSEYERLQKLLMSLYENLADGIIDRDEYARLKQNYAGRCAECEKQMETLQETITQIKEHGGEHREWMAQFREHLNITELERSIVVALIDRILIFKDNRVEVRFRFADEFAWQTDILRRSQIREVV